MWAWASARAMLERLRSATTVTTATILTRVLRTDITGLAGLPAESSSAPARGITGAVADGAVASTDAPVMVTDAATGTVDEALLDAGSRDAVMRDEALRDVVRSADFTAAQFAAEAASTVVEVSTVVGADTVAAVDIAKSIVNQ